MKHFLLITLAMMALSACKEDTAALPDPVEMTAEAMGFYCQMELLNHDGPKGQIHLSGMPAPIFFSQVRDTITYLHMPEQNHAVRVAYVQDMSGAQSWALPGAWVPADKAIYVIGSNQMGGMGAPEFVPFSSPDAAKAFIAAHGGELRRFDEIRPEDVLSVSASATADETDADYDIADRLRALTPADGTN